MCTMPVPSQVRQAPWLLKASSSAKGRKNARRRRGRPVPVPRPLPEMGLHNARWDTGDWPAGKTSAAGCSAALCRCRRYCGCPERPAADEGPAPREHTAPHPPGLWPPGSSGAGCRWTGIPDTGGSPPHREPPEPGRIFRNRIPRRFPQFYLKEHPRLYFSDYALLRRGS